MRTLEQRLYDFLRHGDDKMIRPEDWPVRLSMELGEDEHEYLAHEIAAWLRRDRRTRHRRTKKNESPSTQALAAR